MLPKLVLDSKGPSIFFVLIAPKSVDNLCFEEDTFSIDIPPREDFASNFFKVAFSIFISPKSPFAYNLSNSKPSI